jgi:preprotein translocase subunit YajC
MTDYTAIIKTGAVLVIMFVLVQAWFKKVNRKQMQKRKNSLEAKYKRHWK